MGYSRYQSLVSQNGIINNVPKVIISERTTDRYVSYNSERKRLDRISYETYEKDDSYWWVILMANPEYFCEYDIPNNTIIRVPFPIRDVLAEIDSTLVNNRDLA